MWTKLMLLFVVVVVVMFVVVVSLVFQIFSADVDQFTGRHPSRQRPTRSTTTSTTTNSIFTLNIVVVSIVDVEVVVSVGVMDEEGGGGATVRDMAVVPLIRRRVIKADSQLVLQIFGRYWQ
eukprot:m.289864 g.289864  ORF g.289864 m.289864 type:complete len:121 (-) comp22945_c1_seq6:1972-2334(-)